MWASETCLKDLACAVNEMESFQLTKCRLTGAEDLRSPGNIPGDRTRGNLLLSAAMPMTRRHQDLSMDCGEPSPMLCSTWSVTTGLAGIFSVQGAATLAWRCTTLGEVARAASISMNMGLKVILGQITTPSSLCVV